MIKKFIPHLQKDAMKVFLFSMMFMSYFSLRAQSKVNGTVSSSDGEKLPGVSVVEKGTTKGVVTDANGVYSITVASQATLVFTFIGMEKQEVDVSGKKTVDVVLQSDINMLQEVTVVDYGYGTVRKTDLTGSVATLSGQDIKAIPISNAAQAMTGRLPGVNVLTTDGSPDAEVVIRVRGGGSVTQDNSPLFVVDGFIVSSIRDIPPSDIESINVLKDASATAIYGAQASNGVVVITTKKAVAGRTKVSYNGFLQFKKLPTDRKYEVLSPYEYVMANYEVAKLRSDADVRNFERFFGKYDDLSLYQQKPGTDWQEELFGSPTVSQYHNVGISGGTDKTKINLSLTNNNDQGIMIGSGYIRNVINFKLDQDISKKLKFEGSARLTNTVVNGAGTSGNAQINIKDAVQTRPVNGIADEIEINLNNLDPNDDFQQFLSSLVSPVELVKQDWRKRTTNDYVLNGALSFNIINGLTAKSVYTASRTFDNNLRFYGPLTGESFNNGGNLPLGEKTVRNGNSYRWLNTINYNVKEFNRQKLDFLFGHEIYSTGGDYDLLRAEDFRLSITPEELFANMTFGRTDRHETSINTNSNRLSFFGRANYQLQNKYLATVTFRSDASSKFSKENRVGLFPALALGWKISSEDFMKDATFVDELKLRGSYGQTGNDRIDPTATQFLFVASTLRGPGFGNVDNVYYTPTGSTLYNPNIKWETTINRNLGLDFSFFKARLTGSFDIYKNTTKDLLLQSAIPSNTGFTTQWNNIGSTSNQGVELGLNGFLYDKGDFMLSANFNIGVNRGKIEELDGTTERFFQSNWASTDLKDRDDYYLKVGGRLGDIYGYVTDGFYSTDDFAGYDPVTKKYTLKEGVPNASATVGNTNLRPGFLKLKDLNGDGIINSDDRQVIGNGLPTAQGGFGLNSRYKGFDLSMFFNWSVGNDVYNTGKIQYNQFRRVTYGNLLTDMSSDKRFTYIDIDGSFTGVAGDVVTDLSQLAQMNEGKTIWSPAGYGVAQAVIHSWAVEDGSFVRLNNLNLGYSLPSKLIEKFKMSQLRFYVTGNNLHLWTKYSGYDPEVSTSRSSAYAALTPGVDYSSFPRSRSYTFGVNLTF